MRKSLRRRWPALAAVVGACLAVTAVAGASGPPWVTVTDDFSAEPALFGLALAPNGHLIVADGGAGPTEVRRHGSTSLIASLPGVNDIAPLRKDEMFATAGTDESVGLYKVSPSDVKLLADTRKFENEVDPAGDGTEEGSNPFDLARLGGKSTLIADAAGNSLLIYEDGKLDWVASFPFKFDVPCPAWFCEGTVPFPVQPVPTSVAVGPDGAYYVGELTGFPGTPGQSLVWRIEPGARNVVCGSSPKCTVVGRGFTSIMDLQFGPKNKLYVVELDEASWIAIEPDGPIAPLGGTINECSLGTSLSCTTRASGLPLVTAIAFDGRKLYATLFALVPGQAQVARIP